MFSTCITIVCYEESIIIQVLIKSNPGRHHNYGLSYYSHRLRLLGVQSILVPLFIHCLHDYNIYSCSMSCYYQHQPLLQLIVLLILWDG